MAISNFIEELQEELEFEESLSANSEFQEMEEWDSLSILVVIAVAKNSFSVQLLADEVTGAKTIENLYDLIQSKNA